MSERLQETNFNRKQTIFHYIFYSKQHVLYIHLLLKAKLSNS